MQRIIVLEEEIQTYKIQLENLGDRILPNLIETGNNQPIRHYTHARVVVNRISEINNYILLDKGSNHGITEDMAVISVKGIVGVVMMVTPHFSRIIPVINPGYHPSCMIKNTRLSGSLFWDGKDPRYVSLNGLPSHASSTVGDTIVTSGYSETFPEGVPVGIVVEAVKQKNEEYNSLKVRLFTDFSTLSEVFIIQYPLWEEQKKIEKGVNEE